MLTEYGLNRFLKALGSPFACRVYINGGLQPDRYACAIGYPKVNDTAAANVNRGEHVLTWRYTIPRGTDWGGHPATEAELMDGNDIVDRIPIPPLHASMQYPTVLYLNMVLRRN